MPTAAARVLREDDYLDSRPSRRFERTVEPEAERRTIVITGQPDPPRRRRSAAQEQLTARAGLSLERAAYPLLRRIGEAATVRTSDVAGALSVDVSTVSRQVKQLELEGLVARQPDPTDGRASVLALTPAGHELLTGSYAWQEEAFARLTAGWDPEDATRFAEYLQRLESELP